VSAGQPFPFRNLILFITFIVILVTLVFQGLTLPWVIRTIKPEDKKTHIAEVEQETIIQRNIAETSLRFLTQKYGRERAPNQHLQNLFAKLQIDLRSLNGESQETNGDSLAEYEAVTSNCWSDSEDCSTK
jgi:CPA1 family monovalent cation:H+ antiporter